MKIMLYYKHRSHIIGVILTLENLVDRKCVKNSRYHIIGVRLYMILIARNSNGNCQFYPHKSNGESLIPTYPRIGSHNFFLQSSQPI